MVATSMSSKSLSRSSFSPGLPRVYSRGTPAFSASTLSAPLKSKPSISCTKVKISPPLSHPKQWKVPRSGETKKEGVFSAWKGHRARKLAPARSSFTYCETVSVMDSLSFICWTVSAAIRLLCSRKSIKAKPGDRYVQSTGFAESQHQLALWEYSLEFVEIRVRTINGPSLAAFVHLLV